MPYSRPFIFLCHAYFQAIPTLGHSTVQSSSTDTFHKKNNRKLKSNYPKYFFFRFSYIQKLSFQIAQFVFSNFKKLKIIYELSSRIYSIVKTQNFEPFIQFFIIIIFSTNTFKNFKISISNFNQIFLKNQFFPRSKLIHFKQCKLLIKISSSISSYIIISLKKLFIVNKTFYKS